MYLKMATAHTEKGEKMEWIVEAETRADLVDGQMLICEEIVRCEDCKYCIFQPGTMDFEEMFQYYCTRFKPFKRTSNDYCSYGERRAE